jgi:hypothetical protein
MLTTVAATIDVSRAYLGPARVLMSAGGRAKLEAAGAIVWATVAMGAPYEPVMDDVVLAIAQEECWYVIGVISGSGTTTLTAHAGLVIRAPRGGIELDAATAVTVKSPEVTIAAGRIEILARSIFEHFTEATRWIRDAFQIRAGRVRTRIDGDYDLAADRIMAAATGHVKIDGTTIHLG